MSQGPPHHWNDPPQPRNTAETYGLTTAVPHPLHTNFPSQQGHWYPPDLVPGWRMPMSLSPLEDWRHQHPDQPTSPPPPGQSADSHPTPEGFGNHPQDTGPPMRAATPIPRTPSPLSTEGGDLMPQSELSSFMTPHLHPHPLPEEMTTPLTPTALTTSGPFSLPSTDKSLAPIAPRPGSYEDAMSRLAITSEKMTGPPWTGTWPSLAATPLNDQGYRPRSQQGSSPTGNGSYTAPHLEWSYMASTVTKTPKNSITLRSLYMPLPYERETAQTWMESTYNDFDHFHYDQETFGDYPPEPSWENDGYTFASSPQPFPDSPPHYRIR
ncbi:hypothetical protein ARMSODRAFT_1023790 [Armillaria solidipes]|uniref:Uncharacterized protein n=1 Tax=Armillaria solidipes TaxID=1076256 RepID=A0A2H3BC27_9AGAR|nr:hypothetical protein ARMSODRAFT_1023790 [Armillaria solidipes]